MKHIVICSNTLRSVLTPKNTGDVKLIEAHGSKFRVSINADAPLQFEKKVGFPNGDIGTVTFEYVGLHRYCFTCKLLSHEEGFRPNLTEDQRQRNKLFRAEKNGNQPNIGWKCAQEPSNSRFEEQFDTRSYKVNSDISYRSRSDYRSYDSSSKSAMDKDKTGIEEREGTKIYGTS